MRVSWDNTRKFLAYKKRPMGIILGQVHSSNPQGGFLQLLSKNRLTGPMPLILFSRLICKRSLSKFLLFLKEYNHKSVLGTDVSPQISYVEAPIRNVVLFGDGAIGRWLCLDGVVRVEPPDGISARYRDEEPRVLSLSAMWGYSKKGAICKWGSHQTPNLPGPWSWTFQPASVRNKCILFKPPSVSYIC